jgi:hypothetical protein
MSLMTAPPSRVRSLEVVPGELGNPSCNPSHVCGEFSTKKNGLEVGFGGTVDFVLPPFTSAWPNATLYYESGKQPRDWNSFTLYIDNQGIRIVFEDRALIIAVFDQEIVLDAKGYEIQGKGIYWIGRATSPDI